MCTVTLILPHRYPQTGLSKYIRPLAETGMSANPECYLGGENLVWHNQGYYFLFLCQPRQLTLNAVSDFNPLIGCRAQSLERALNSVAMDYVDRLIVRRQDYKVTANTGNILLKELRKNLGSRFLCSRWAVKNYFGPLPAKIIDDHYRQLIALAEQAIIRPEKLILVAPDSEGEAKSFILIDSDGRSFKCRLSKTRLRITLASPPGSFSIHAFRNRNIKITDHCLERFAVRVLGQELDSLNPILAQGELLKFIKNKAVGHSYRLGRTAFINVSGCVFIGTISQGRMTLVTVYKETLVDVPDFHAQVLDLLQKPGEAKRWDLDQFIPISPGH